jgi:nucleoid-associated protein EbfC
MSKRRGGRGGRSGGAPNPNAMMKQIQKMQEDMAVVQAALEDETVEVSVGGGALTIVISGAQQVQSISIDPDLIDPDDDEGLTDLQDLLVAGMNQAIEQSQALAAERMGDVTGGMESMLPGGLGGLLG